MRKYKVKRLFAWILACVITFTNVNIVPVYAAENETIAETILFETDFSDNGMLTTYKMENRNGGAGWATDDVTGRCLNIKNSSGRIAKTISGILPNNNLTIEMKVKTVNGGTGDIRLNNSASAGSNYLWQGTTGGEWVTLKIELTLGDTITSTAFVNGQVCTEYKCVSFKSTIQDGTTYLIMKNETAGADAEVRFDDIKIYCNYNGSLLDALEKAAVGTNIKLLKYVTATGKVKIISGVTLDLNGNTLDMGDNYLISEGNVVDSSTAKTGRLKIATYAESEVEQGKESLIGTPKGKLAENNSQMPVYIDGEGYMLANMTPQFLTPTIDTDYFTSVSRPSFGDPHYEKLKSGASAAKLQFILRLDWSTVTNDVTNTYYQEFSYSDDLVQNVYTNGKAFSVTVNGLADYALKNNVSEYVVSEYVKSDLGVVLKNNSFSMNTTSGK